ncbi:MAG: hypothetical protein RR826_04575, partial [Christensenellaceae bacterium]
MALTKITRINTKVNVVEGLETRPQMPPQTLKQKFDEDSVNLKADVNGIVDGVNAVIDELTSTNGASNIGVSAIAGVDGATVQTALGGLKTLLDKEKGKTDTHMANTENPHGVTKVQVGLSNVDNTSDASKPVSAAQA